MNRRLVLVECQEPFLVEEKPIPRAPPGGAVVRTLFAGICHSDVHIWEHLVDPNMSLPLVMGHEISGEVHELGPGVTDPSVPVIGSKVIVYPWECCGECVYCKAGVGSRQCTGKQKTYQQLGLYLDGGFQQYVVVPKASMLIPTPQGVPLDVCAISACSGLTAYNVVTSMKRSLDEAVRLTGTCRVVLVGAGGLCLWAISLLKVTWPDVYICVVDLHKEKIRDAVSAGADVGVVWNMEDDMMTRVKAIQDVCGKQGFDGAVDFTGHSDTAVPVFRTMAKNGTWVVIGLAGGVLPQIPFGALIVKAVTLKGLMVGTKGQLTELLHLMTTKRVLAPPISHVTMDQVDQTIQRLRDSRQPGRAVIRFDPTPTKL